MSQTPDAVVKKKSNNLKILLFIVILCFISSLLLAVLAFSLKNAQEEAKELDRSKQMLIAARILNHGGNFILIDEKGQIQNATFDESTNKLVPFKNGKPPVATTDQIKKISEQRIRPLLTDATGKLYTLKEKEVDLDNYLSQNKKTGYAAQPHKLFYVILPNDKNEKHTEESKEFEKVYGYVFPVSGFGLWAPIYGYLALGPDGDQVIGTSWYEHAETPGLGANIVEAWWQKQFFGKLVFQEQAPGKTDFKTAPIGLIVVKGKVQDVFGNSPRAKSAVDGMSGATLTGDGVTAAYQNSMNPYRQLLINIHNQFEKNSKQG